MTQESPFIVEFVGVAGSGKTAISQALSHQNPLIKRSLHPNTRSFRDTPFYIINCLKLLLFFSRSRNDTLQLCRRELAWLAVLQGWPDYLLKKYRGNQVIILDQGPIFLTADIHQFDIEKLRSSIADRWWRGIFNLWSHTLNMIVWFDAEDEKLRERIRNRDKGHLIKNSSDVEMQAFLNQHRIIYQQAIPLWVRADGEPKIVTIDTSDRTIADISDRLLAEFGL
jgi:thymidylate kinase